MEASDIKLASYLIHVSLCSLSIVGKPLVQQQNVNIHSTCVLGALAHVRLQDPHSRHKWVHRALRIEAVTQSSWRMTERSPEALGGLYYSLDQWTRGHGFI